jgi:hypothetical protein
MKYICIDSNIYRNIFSPSESFSDEIKDSILELIDKNKISLLLPVQVKQEVERNRFSSWYESSLSDFTQKIKKKEEEIEAVKLKYTSYKAHSALIKDILKSKKELEKIIRDLKSRFKSKRSRANQTLKDIFDKAVIVGESTEIIDRADTRTKKRNPPRDSEGYYGDAIIWESLLQYFRNRDNGSDELVLISNDKTAWGTDGLDLWLEDEWKKEAKCKIKLAYAISEVPELAKEKQEKMKQAETDSLKENLINDFINSGSFIDAGHNADKLLTIKNKLTKDDFEKIISGSLKNHEIFGSFFTPAPLKQLVSDKGEFVNSEIENIDDKLWEEFNKRFEFGLFRIKDIPF